MKTEERVLRLENAFAALSELAASTQSNTEILTGLVRTVDERSNGLLQLVQSIEERSSTQQEWINQLGATQANAEVKISALTDAQIRTEETFNRMGEAQANADARVAAQSDCWAEKLSSRASAQGSLRL